MKKSFENIPLTPKRKLILIEPDRGKEFHNSIFQISLKNNSIKLYFRNSSIGAVFAERFNRTVRDLLTKLVFGKVDGIWIDGMFVITKQCNNRVHTCTNLTPKQASLNKRRLCLRKFFRQTKERKNQSFK